MLESISICRQALGKLKPGPMNCDDARLALPDKQAVYHDMEALINQFKLIYEGVRPPAGECYDATEAANGELGFFIVSDGGTNPYKIKVRPPCLTQWAAFADMVEGHQVADAFATLGSINIIAGEAGPMMSGKWSGHPRRPAKDLTLEQVAERMAQARRPRR